MQTTEKDTVNQPIIEKDPMAITKDSFQKDITQKCNMKNNNPLHNKSDEALRNWQAIGTSP